MRTGQVVRGVFERAAIQGYRYRLAIQPDRSEGLRAEIEAAEKICTYEP
jgi:hypothetical protein